MQPQDCQSSPKNTGACMCKALLSSAGFCRINGFASRATRECEIYFLWKQFSQPIRQTVSCMGLILVLAPACNRYAPEAAGCRKASTPSCSIAVDLGKRRYLRDAIFLANRKSLRPLLATMLGLDGRLRNDFGKHDSGHLTDEGKEDASNMNANI
jgi:hypothetical protein